MGTKIFFKPFCADKKVLQWFLNFIETQFDLSFISSIHPSDRSNDYWAKVTIVISEGWENLPATERQLATLDGLMVDYDPEIRRGEASRIIKDQLNRRAIA